MKLFLTQWRAEMRKLIARKRTFLGFGAFVLLEVVIFAVLHLDNEEVAGTIEVDAEGFVQRRLNRDEDDALRPGGRHGGERKRGESAEAHGGRETG